MEIFELLQGGPAALVSFPLAVVLAGFLVAQSKPLLRLVLRRFAAAYQVQDDERPWGLLAVLYGVAIAVLMSQSAFAPDWLSDPALTVIAGVGIGYAASVGRDALVQPPRKTAT